MLLTSHGKTDVPRVHSVSKQMLRIYYTPQTPLDQNLAGEWTQEVPRTEDKMKVPWRGRGMFGKGDDLRDATWRIRLQV